MKRNLNSAGMTLLELLIVISILGLLAQLLLPAIQAARETARATGCKNNLRQLAVGSELHTGVHNHLPTGGWTHAWVGDPDRGAGQNQPGGWLFNLLPYIEQEALHNIGKGQPDAQKRLAAKTQFETPLPIYLCPSRRDAIAYPFMRSNTLVNVANPDVAGRNDYAANIGDLEPADQRSRGPNNLDEGDSWNEGNDQAKDWVAMYHNGVIYQRSHVQPGQISDGQSKTLLFGEKFLNPSHYLSGLSDGDDHAITSGFDRDNARSTNLLHPPMHDRIVPQVWLRFGDNETVTDWNFGSAHPVGCNMAICDGSVRQVNYDIDPAVYSAYGSRNGNDNVADH
jgi:prepilin-type N-terminal cleavage/methylation domain-containing protein